MGKTIIHVDLSEAGINKAVKELEKYKRNFLKKTELLRRKVAERIAQIAQTGFDSSIVDDLVAGAPRAANVTVTVESGDNITLVVAHGEDAVWVEFGAGVYHNGSVGSSPHPKGSDLGFTIGTYGKGRGARQTWGFRDDEGLHLTHGTPATMPLYGAMKRISDEIYEIAREVFR